MIMVISKYRKEDINMIRKLLVVFSSIFIFLSLTSCSLVNRLTTSEVSSTSDKPVVPTTTGASRVPEKPEQTDFSKLSNRDMENKVKYEMNYKPKDGYVGDVMPYYENGTFYIFFLKDQGNSYNHSIFLVETKDFLHYEEKGEILRSSSNYNDQDNWIGTGSVCKVDNTYYFFYTGHNERLELHERVMVATSENDLYHFKKLEGVYIDPTNQLSKNDFRDPDVTYDSENDNFILTVTTNANIGGTVIVKYTVSKDLKTYNYDKIIYTDTEDFWNLECTDTFKINNYWYLSYSGQDDTLWVAKSRSQYSGYGNTLYGPAVRVEGKYFYAPKAVSDEKNTYFVGWGRRKGQFRDDGKGSWGGNIVVSKVHQNEDGSIYLEKLDNLNDYFRYDLELENKNISINQKKNFEIEKQYESFIFEGDFKYSGNSDFGFVFGLGKDEADYGHIIINPSKKVMEFSVKNFKTIETEVKINTKEGELYHFTLVSEGSVLVFYIDGMAAMTTRFYGKLDSNFGVFTKGSDVEFSNLTLKLRA